MFEAYQVNPSKINEAEVFRQGIIDLDSEAFPQYKRLKQDKVIPTDYLIYIGMSKNKELLTCVRELYRLYSIEYPLTTRTLADEYCKQRELSKKDKDLEDREGQGGPGKFHICYKKGDYIVVATQVIPREAKKGCWRYGMNLKKKDDEMFYNRCVNTMSERIEQ